MSKEQIERAHRMSEKMMNEMKRSDGTVKDSIKNGGGTPIGCLGEIIFADAMGIPLSNTFDYDLNIGGLKVDVKTKSCTSKPRMSYYATVAEANTKQQCDYYVFVRIMEDMSKGWILGKKKKADFYDESIFNVKGDPDPTSNNGYTFRANCYNLPIEKLDPIFFPERNEKLLEAYAKYMLMPLASISESSPSEIYSRYYVVLTGRAIIHPHPHRHFTLKEFEDKMLNDATFKEFCEKLELPK